MAPIYWIIGFVVIGVLFWRAMRSNGHRTTGQRRAEAASDLARENYRLRHVLAQLSIDNHALRYTPPDYW